MHFNRGGPLHKPRFLEQGPKLALGEESGKQSGDVPQNRGPRVRGDGAHEKPESV